jgi:RNA polymerase sigma-70 factor (ECF subfamily)
MNDDSREQSGIAELVKAAQAGDKMAFGRLVQSYQRQAMGLALGILGNVHDAAEVVQEAFVKAYVGLGGLSRPERFRFWLLKIVSNEAISRRRAVRRLGIVTKLFLLDRVERENADELQAAIEGAMRQLTGKEAEAITLFGLDGLPHGEVGRIMGCSAGAVRWHVHRARKKLRVLLKEYLE